MNAQVFRNGVDITSYVVSYTREQQICTGVGNMNLAISNTYPNAISTYDTIVLWEGGVKKATYVVSSITDNVSAQQILLGCQDGSKRCQDYFLDETYLVETPTTARYWIGFFLDLAGITYNIIPSDTGNLVTNGTIFGRSDTLSTITQLLQMNGWYLYFDANNTAQIGRFFLDIDQPSESFDDTDILDYASTKNDSMFRNRIVVYGQGDPETSIWVHAEIDETGRHSCEYPGGDTRSVVIANSYIPDNSAAMEIATKAINEFNKENNELTIDVHGPRDLTLGDVIYVDSEYGNWLGMVTTIGSRLGSDGHITHIVLDQRCPRLFSYFDFGGSVYVGTEGNGIWRKYLEFDHTWSDFSTGIPAEDRVVTDLKIWGGLYVCIANKKIYYRTRNTNWILFNPSAFIDVDTDTSYTSAVACGCNIDQSRGEILALYSELSINKSWVITISSRGIELSRHQVKVVIGSEQKNARGFDIAISEGRPAITGIVPGNNFVHYNWPDRRNRVAPSLGQYTTVVPVTSAYSYKQFESNMVFRDGSAFFLSNFFGRYTLYYNYDIGGGVKYDFTHASATNAGAPVGLNNEEMLVFNGRNIIKVNPKTGTATTVYTFPLTANTTAVRDMYLTKDDKLIVIWTSSNTDATPDIIDTYYSIFDAQSMTLSGTTLLYSESVGIISPTMTELNDHVFFRALIKNNDIMFARIYDVGIFDTLIRPTVGTTTTDDNPYQGFANAQGNEGMVFDPVTNVIYYRCDNASTDYKILAIDTAMNISLVNYSTYSPRFIKSRTNCYFVNTTGGEVYNLPSAGLKIDFNESLSIASTMDDNLGEMIVLSGNKIWTYNLDSGVKTQHIILSEWVGGTLTDVIGQIVNIGSYYAIPSNYIPYEAFGSASITARNVGDIYYVEDTPPYNSNMDISLDYPIITWGMHPLDYRLFGISVSGTLYNSGVMPNYLPTNYRLGMPEGSGTAWFYPTVPSGFIYDSRSMREFMGEASGIGYRSLATRHGLNPSGDSSIYVVDDNFTSFVASVYTTIHGQVQMLETTNNQTTPYIFVSVSGETDYKFYQRDSSDFSDITVADFVDRTNNLPNYKINVIRVDDKV